MANFSFLFFLFFAIWVVFRKKSSMQDEEIAKAKSRQQAYKNARQSVQSPLAARENVKSAVNARRSNLAKSGVHPDMPTKVKGGLKSGANAKVSESLHDDRNNDWLANQMREERNSLFKLREMFGFQMQGRGITEAEMLKDFHASHCNADGVDTAQGR